MRRRLARLLPLLAAPWMLLAPPACRSADSTATGAPDAAVTSAPPPEHVTPIPERPLPSGPLNRLQWTDFAYLGAFSCPRTRDWSYLDYTGIAYVPTRKTLIMAGRKGLVEMSIPEPVISPDDDPRDLPTAEELGQPLSLSQQFRRDLPFKSRRLGGLTWLEGRIWVAMYEFYNVAARDNPGIVTLSDRLDDPRGAWRVGPKRVNRPFQDTFHANKTHGYVCSVPPSWAATYAPGKTLASGRHRGAGAFGGAQGPALFVFEPDADRAPGGDLGGVPLMIYPTKSKKWIHGDYRNDDSFEVVWVWTDKGQAVLVGSTHGLGQDFYGPGPADCYPAKGWHAPPYEPRVYLIDAFDLAQVATGAMRPSDPQPYETLVPDFPWRTPKKGENPECRHPWISSMSYDPGTRRLYVVQARAYEYGDSNGTIVHVFQVSDG